MPDCETCKERQAQAEPIPFIAHESAMARMERTIKRLWILLMVMLVLLVGSNVAWIIYEAQFETVEVTQEVEQDADNGTNNFVGGDYYGTAEGQNNG